MASLAPKLVDRYLLKQLLDYFMLGVVVFTLIAFFSETLLKFINDVTKYGVPFTKLLTLLGLQLPKSVALVLPASAFVAVLMVYNQLNNNFEIVAMRTNGISLWRLAAPALALGLLCSGVAYYLNDYVVPWCNNKTEAMKRDLLRTGTLPAGGNSFIFPSFDKQRNLVKMIYISHYEGRKLGDSTIIDLSKPDVMQVVQARSGILDSTGGWVFQNANIYLVAKDVTHSSAGHSQKFLVRGLTSQEKDVEKIEQHVRQDQDLSIILTKQQSFMDVWQRIQYREARDMKVPRSNYLDMWKKITWPLCCFALILAAVPLSLSPPRRGSNRGFIFAIVVLFWFYMLYSVFQSMGQSHFIHLGFLSLPHYLALVSWLPLLIMMLIGMVLMQRKSQVL